MTGLTQSLIMVLVCRRTAQGTTVGRGNERRGTKQVFSDELCFLHLVEICQKIANIQTATVLAPCSLEESEKLKGIGTLVLSV